MVWLLLCTEAMPSRDRSNELIALAARRPVKAAGTIELVVGDLAGESIEAIVSPVGDGATSVCSRSPAEALELGRHQLGQRTLTVLLEARERARQVTAHEHRCSHSWVWRGTRFVPAR